MDNNHVSKKTMGRRKIEIKKIEKKTSLQVTFTKRRTGLFRKASELSVLCGAEIAILVQSPAEKVFAFGHPSVESMINRFQMGEDLPPEMAASSSHGGEIILPEDGTRSKFEESLIDCFQRGEALWPEMAAISSHGGQIIIREDGRSKYEEAVRRLEMEKRRTEEKEREFWWDQSYEGLELHELEEYVEALEVLRDNVSQRVEEMEKLMKLEGGLGSTPSNQELSASASTSSNLFALPNHDQPVDYDLFDFIH